MANKTINYSIEISKAQEIQEIIQEDGYNYTVKFDTVWKNNVELKGLQVRGEENVAPTLYYTNEDVLELAHRIEAIIDKGIPEFQIVDLFNHDYVEKNIYPVLISDTMYNRESLIKNNQPFDHMISSESGTDDGLLIILKLKVFDNVNPGEHASITLSKQHLEMSGFEFSQALDQAVRNVNDDVSIVSMTQLMREMIGSSLPWEDPDNDMSDCDDEIYVMTNISRFHGANTILSKPALEMLADQLGTNDFYILPSSIHEVLAVRGNNDPYQAETLKNMVREVNASEVQPEDRLCDGIFHYENGSLVRVA